MRLVSDGQALCIPLRDLRLYRTPATNPMLKSAAETMRHVTRKKSPEVRVVETPNTTHTNDTPYIMAT